MERSLNEIVMTHKREMGLAEERLKQKEGEIRQSGFELESMKYARYEVEREVMGLKRKLQEVEEREDGERRRRVGTEKKEKEREVVRTEYHNPELMSPKSRKNDGEDPLMEEFY